MPNSIGWLAVTLLFNGIGEAQQSKEDPCRSRFSVAESNQRERWGVWPEDARKWWDEEGKKKFPELCETTSQNAEFAIEWIRRRSTEERNRAKIDEMWLASPGYECYTTPGENVCYTDANNRLFCQTTPPQKVCEFRPLSTPGWEAYSIEVERISVTAYRVRQAHYERVASVTKAGYVAKDRPGRASFQSAMKTLKIKAFDRR